MFLRVKRADLLVLSLLLLPGLPGCIRHTYRVQQPIMPKGALKNATADQLVQVVNSMSRSTESLRASVTFQVSVGGVKRGQVTDYTSLSGYILLRDPGMVRVLGLLPVVHTQAFDLASDGKTFTLLVPHNNKAYTGSNAIDKPSSNPIENLRPGIFFETLIPQESGPNEQVFLTTINPTREDPKTHQVFARPQYLLWILQHKENSQELVPLRRFHFDRTTLLMSGIDTYDSTGTVETQGEFGPYATFGDVSYPGTITIQRPAEEYQIVIAIQKLTRNQPLADDQFAVKIPEGYTVQTMQ